MTDADVGKDAALIERLERALDEANRTGEAATLRPVDLAATISALCYTRPASVDDVERMREAIDAMLAYDLAAAKFKSGGCDYATLNKAGNRKEAALAAIKL